MAITYSNFEATNNATMVFSRIIKFGKIFIAFLHMNNISNYSNTLHIANAPIGFRPTNGFYISPAHTQHRTAVDNYVLFDSDGSVSMAGPLSQVMINCCYV